MALSPANMRRRRAALLYAAAHSAFSTANMLKNPGLDADTDWTKGTGWTITGGVATFTATGSASNLSQTVTDVRAGKKYRVEVNMTRAAGTLTVRLGGTTDQLTYTATGNYVGIVVAETTDKALVFRAGTTFTGTILNVALLPYD